MNVLATQIIEAGYANQVLSEQQLARIIQGSDDRRYGLVKRALQANALWRVKRGRYVLADKHRPTSIHPFRLAQSLVVGSYISMETALAFHGWIPEAVYTNASITPGRKTEAVKHEHLGQYDFYPLALNRGYFLEGVSRHTLNDQTVLIANPLRALMDLVAYRKQQWTDLNWVLISIRIDIEYLFLLTRKDFQNLQDVYKHKVVRSFLHALEEDLRIVKDQGRALKNESNES